MKEKKKFFKKKVVNEDGEEVGMYMTFEGYSKGIRNVYLMCRC
jgi:hypothetical protein